tara:strand:+ start:491 stop:736 length:246 start_codon:yes stop_codon:yes gene_type:complete
MTQKKEHLEILDEVIVATLINSASCHIEPIIGNTYHLYKRQDATCFISLVEPEFWDNKRFKIKFVSSLVYTSEGIWNPIAV